MSDAAPQTTLRETLEAAVEQHTAEPTTTTPPPEVTSVEHTAAPGAAPETEQQKSDRLRDEKGRFVEGKAAPAKAAPQLPGAVVAQPVEIAKPHPQRPSRWKKDYWEKWDKIEPDVAEYILQREGEYAKGVSTYKGVHDQAKPILDALAPHLADFERMGINVGQQMDRYATIHKTLALGSPEQKLGLFAKLVQDYRIPVEQMFVRGQDGQVYLNQQLMQQAQAPAPQPQANVDQIVEQKLAQREAANETKNFREAKDASGQLLHPHFETVRETMAQLLDAKVVDDIPSAYDAALKLPKHSDLYAAEQQLQAAR